MYFFILQIVIPKIKGHVLDQVSVEGGVPLLRGSSCWPDIAVAAVHRNSAFLRTDSLSRKDRGVVWTIKFRFSLGKINRSFGN